MKRFTELFDKSYLLRVLTRVLTAVFALGVVFYIFYHIADRFESGLVLLDASSKTVVRTIDADAYIFRDETVLYGTASSGGSVTPSVHNGEKVYAYAKVADVYNYTAPEVEKRVAEIDEQILLLEQSRSEDLSVLNTAGLDSEIYRNAEAIRIKSENGSFGDALSSRTDFLVSIKKRDILTGTVRNFDEQIRLLEGEKSQLTARLGAKQETVYASVPGYYYAETDGYESIFTSAALETVTYDELMALTREQPVSGAFTVGKIATDFRWYIACPMTKAESGMLSENETYSVTFPYNNRTLEMTLIRVTSETSSGGNAAAVFECQTLPYDFSYTRMQPVQIRAMDYEGFEIPASAIRVVDGYQGVYVLDEVTVDFRRVNIIYEYDGYFLCTGEAALPDAEEEEDEERYRWIALNDVIITEGKNLEIGKVIGRQAMEEEEKSGLFG